MRMMSTLLCALVSGAVLFLANPALAQTAPTPGDVLGATSDAMLQITSDAAEAQRGATGATVRRVEALDEAGASDETLRSAARRGAERLTDIAGVARERLDGVTSRALGALEAIKAPAVFAEAVRRARGLALERVQRTTQTGARIILDALSTALSGESEETGAGAA